MEELPLAQQAKVGAENVHFSELSASAGYSILSIRVLVSSTTLFYDWRAPTSVKTLLMPFDLI